VLQNTETNYETDLFMPLISAVVDLTGHEYEMGPGGTAHRVIADHVRALSFSIADGAMPSNEGRGYVLRRILRRAARHGRQLGLHEPFLAKLLTPLTDVMGEAFPELGAQRAHIENVLAAEEEQFGRTLDVGIDMFEQYATVAEKDGTRLITGAAAFKLYDTYGFPFDLTAVMARERGLAVDEAGFEEAMNRQRERSREAGAFGQIYVQGSRPEWKNFGTTEFLYDTYETEAKLLAYAPNDGAVILDRTPFYVESGGQVSDVGMITAPDLIFEVKDLVRDGDLILHLGESLQGASTKSETATASVALERRRAIERNHTATHLLHAALRKVLGDHVHQAGSLVAPDRLRFDFTHHQALTSEELEQIEALANAQVLNNVPLQVELSDFDTAKERGAMALFGEKYGDEVRVVSVPGYSSELCGGTHVRATGEIGMLRIVSEGAVAAGVRRIEAVTGEGARAWSRERDRLLETVTALLKGEVSQAPERVERLLERQRELEQKIRQMESQAARHAIKRNDETLQQAAGHQYTFHFGPEWQRHRVTAVADELKKEQEDQSGVFGFVDPERGKVNLFFAASAGAIASGVHAGEAVQFITGTLGGRGGGKPHLGQGGFDAAGMAESEIVDKLKASVGSYFAQI
jgi:alanyl-tRNA synthetase